LSRHCSATSSDNSIILNTIVKRNYNGQAKGRKYPQLVINKVKGRREVQLATQTDKELCQQIDYYNEYLSMINSTKAPRILQDIISSSKPKQSTYVKHVIIYLLT
jgi:hypothetical protein